MNRTVDKSFIIWTEGPSSNFKELRSLLTASNWKVVSSVGSKLSTDLTNSLANEEGGLYCLALLDPRDYLFSSVEIDLIHRFCFSNNSLIIASSDNESGLRRSNVNKISIRFGVQFNEDCVIRPNLYKYYHPKETLLQDFIVNRGITDVIMKYIKQSPHSVKDSIIPIGPQVIYPSGCTLQVNRTSAIMLTSSKWNLPNNQAVCSFYKGTGDIRVICIGSTALMTDQYLKLEDNVALINTLLEFVVNKQFVINISDAKTIEVPDAFITPDINQLADVPIPCIQESEPLPEDKSSLIENKLYSIDCSCLPMVVRAYQDLNVANEPLTLLRPRFELKFPDVEPAIHGFILRRQE